MKIFLTVFVLWLTTMALVHAEDKTMPATKAQVETPNTIEAELLSDIRARLDALARNDISTWSRYVADEMLSPLEGSISSKQAWINQHKSWPADVKYYYGPLEDVKVRLHGDTAIVTYRTKQYNEIGGQTTYFESWQIETHLRQNKKWLLIAVADSPMPLEPATANVDPKLYDAYVGRYQWAPTLISTITRQNSKLFEQTTGQEKTELAPESDTTFFVPGLSAQGDSSRWIFMKDSAGRVTHYIYRQWGATDRIVKKID